MQAQGTGVIGRIFGPVMLVWFLAIGVLGAFGISQHPAVLVALDPLHATGFVLHAPLAVSFAVLSACLRSYEAGRCI